MDILLNIVEILKDLNIIQSLTNLGFFGIAAFFIKKIIENSAQKRLEEFKSTLVVIQNKQDVLHNTRVEIISELYSLLVTLNSSMYQLTIPVKQIPEGIEYDEMESKLMNKANLDYQNFNKFYQGKKIYFEETTCDIIDSILDTFQKAIWDYNEHKYYKPLGDKLLFKEAKLKMIDAYKSIEDEIPKVKSKLETNFREILDVIKKQ